MQATLLKTVCVRLTFQENIPEGDSLKNALHLSHLDNYLIKFIHKTFTYLQTEMYLISFTKATYSHTKSTNKSSLQKKNFAFVNFFYEK